MHDPKSFLFGYCLGLIFGLSTSIVVIYFDSSNKSRRK